LIASVSAAGMPVTAGTVSFTAGNQLLGSVALGNDGTAQLSTSTLPAGEARIQAIYNGTADDLASLSPVLIQAVDRFTTTTSLTLAAQRGPDGRLRYLLVATVIANGTTELTPVGTVVFRRNRAVIGRARLTGGTAVIAIGRHVPSRGRFVAAFQGSSRFRPSSSLPLRVPV
jgi:hypothetical protein